VVDLTNSDSERDTIDVDSYIVDFLLVKVVKADPDKAAVEAQGDEKPDSFGNEVKVKKDPDEEYSPDEDDDTAVKDGGGTNGGKGYLDSTKDTSSSTLSAPTKPTSIDVNPALITHSNISAAASAVNSNMQMVHHSKVGGRLDADKNLSLLKPGQGQSGSPCQPIVTILI